jgi:hypothetical protein
MKHAAIAFLMAHLVSLGCGGSGDDPPTQPTPRTQTFEETMGGEIPGHTSQCFDFGQGAAGSAYASVAPAVPLELGTGRCNQTRTVVARSDTGEVTTTLPAGDSFVRVENPGDGRLNYQIRLRHIFVF